ncbi:MAG: methionyl-tRNA formyltransferase [Minisyncoccia bacterium]
MNKLTWAFFGSSEFSVTVLEQLKSLSLLPNLIVTIEDKPKGRKLILTKEEVKVWAEKENIPVLQLKTLKSEESFSAIKNYFPEGADVFVVTHYGKMIPDNILYFPKHKTLNIHPSLLPKLRGPSPIKSAILSENKTGVSIIRLDSEMDHGPILAQKNVTTTEWPPYEEELENILATTGANLLFELLPSRQSGSLKEAEQDHAHATFCTKIEKKDGEIDLNDSPEKNLRKIRAFHNWPGAYFFSTKGRVIVKRAKIENDKLIIEKVIPEGKKEMSYVDYLRGQKN